MNQPNRQPAAAHSGEPFSSFWECLLSLFSGFLECLSQLSPLGFSGQGVLRDSSSCGLTPDYWLKKQYMIYDI